jgi:hypothetical protein
MCRLYGPWDGFRVHDGEERCGADLMNDSDARRAHREAAQLHAIVDDLFGDPRMAQPQLVDAGSRPPLRSWQRPSFAVHRCWAVWGRRHSDQRASNAALARRITWRWDLDVEGRSDPMDRLRRLGEKLEPTIEVADSRVPLVELSERLARFPAMAALDKLVERGRMMMLDGTRYGIDLDAGTSRIRIEWAGDGSWEVDWPYESVSAWAHEISRWIDEAL